MHYPETKAIRRLKNSKPLVPSFPCDIYSACISIIVVVEVKVSGRVIVSVSVESVGYPRSRGASSFRLEGVRLTRELLYHILLLFG